MRLYPECPWNWKHIICDTEDDLSDEGQAILSAPGDEAFVKSNRKAYIRTEEDTWEEKFDGLTSSPPSGKCKVTNLYVDPVSGKLTIEYDNNPVP